MRRLRVALLLVGLALVAGLAATQAATGASQQTPKDNIWKDEPKQTPPSWWQRELSDDTISRIMKGIEVRDPAQARRLEDLRKKDPVRFKAQVREQGQPELDQVIRERFETRRLERNAKFVEWLKANYPREEETLAKLKEKSPQVYINTFDRLLKEYGYIYEADASNPEMGAVLKEDRELKKRADVLYKQIRDEKSEAKKQALGIELQDVIAKRYDLIVRRKEIAYEQLLKKLDELQEHVRESKDEIAKWRDPKIKQENVKQRVQDLTGNKVRFKWD
jgi:hypothetical protein